MYLEKSWKCFLIFQARPGKYWKIFWYCKVLVIGSWSAWSSLNLTLSNASVKSRLALNKAYYVTVDRGLCQPSKIPRKQADTLEKVSEFCASNRVGTLYEIIQYSIKWQPVLWCALTCIIVNTQSISVTGVSCRLIVMPSGQ